MYAYTSETNAVTSDVTWVQTVPLNGTIMTTQLSGQIGIAGQPNQIGVPQPKTPPIGHVSLKLFFSFVKSKFTKLERQAIQKAMRRYQALRLDARANGQFGLYEKLSAHLLLAAREQQVLACGFERMILRVDAEKYIGKVDCKVVLQPLESFPRVIPPKPAERLKLARSRGLFDDYVVLYHPATTESAKSTAQKIREKDPILFGVFNHSPEFLYVVADWVDEHCDLTVEKLEKDYALTTLHEPTEVDVDALKKELLENDGKLRAANVSTWRKLEADAKLAQVASAAPPAPAASPSEVAQVKPRPWYLWWKA